MVDEEAKAVTGTVPIQGHSDPWNHQVHGWGAGAGPCSPFVLSRSECVKSDPLNLSAVQKSSKAPWKGSRIWKVKVSERRADEYGELIRRTPLIQALYLTVEEAIDTNGRNLFMLC